jgi:hypothetical protein
MRIRAPKRIPLGGYDLRPRTFGTFSALPFTEWFSAWGCRLVPRTQASCTAWWGDELATSQGARKSEGIWERWLARADGHQTQCPEVCVAICACLPSPEGAKDARHTARVELAPIKAVFRPWCAFTPLTGEVRRIEVVLSIPTRVRHRIRPLSARCRGQSLRMWGSVMRPPRGGCLSPA